MSARNNDDHNSKSTLKWQCGEPYQFPITKGGDHWERLLAPLLEKDHAQCESWRDEVQNLLIFAGLFSAVLSTFVVVSYQALQPNQNEIMTNLLAHIAARLDNPVSGNSPSQPIDISSLSTAPAPSSIRTNVFWFISLVLSLTTALIGIVALQWLREHERYPSSLPTRQKFALFNMREEGLEAWYVPHILSSLPLLLQLALTLFFVGLIDFLFSTSLSVAIPVVLFMSIPFVFLILTTTIPALQTFIFCLPLTDRDRRVPQQAPYKSPQSRLFRRLLAFSSHAFSFSIAAIHGIYRFFLFWPSLFRRDWKPRQRPTPQDMDFGLISELESLGDDLFDTFSSPSWLRFDEDWLVMRDAYAKSIFEKDWCMKNRNRFRTKESAPFYDLTRGINSTTLEYGRTDANIICAGYNSLQEMTSIIIGEKAPLVIRRRSRSYNLYLQSLLTFEDLRKPPSTFSSLLEDPSADFMRDENGFIFLSLPTRLPPLIFRHFIELHVRIANYLYSRDDWPSVREPPLADYPTYPDHQFWYAYGKSPWQEAKYGSSFTPEISEQFSSFVRSYIEVVVDPDVEMNSLLKSFYVLKLGEFFEYAASRQAPENVPITLDLLGHAMDSSIAVGTFHKKSDLLFYTSALYTRSLLLTNPEFPTPKPPGDVPTVPAFLPVLRRYVNARGAADPDPDLRKRLGIPDTSDPWWEFLNHQEFEDELQVVRDAKSAEPEMRIPQMLGSLPPVDVLDIPFDKEAGEFGSTNPNTRADDLV